MTKVEYREYLSLLRKADGMEDLEFLLSDYWNKSHFTNLNSSSGSSTGYKRWKWFPVLGVAASITILVLSTIFLLNNQDHPGFITYNTDFGQTKEIKLPDGSAVTLNANSQILWNNDWESKGVRTVEIEGEAFFDIQHLENDMPFRVIAGDIQVAVLGTSFNVNNREDNTEVYLEEGKVALQLEEKGDTLINMKPGEKVQYSGADRSLKKSENETMRTSASWKNGVLNFKNLSFRDVLEELRNIYGKSFECRDVELLERPMYLGFPYADWEAVKQALELSLSIQFVESGKRYKVEKE